MVIQELQEQNIIISHYPAVGQQIYYCRGWEDLFINALDELKLWYQNSSHGKYLFNINIDILCGIGFDEHAFNFYHNTKLSVSNIRNN